MAFTIVSTHLDGIVVLQPQRHDDDRGWFIESFREDQLRDLGIATDFVQDNHSHSRRDVIRGLHYTVGQPMGKLLRVVRGAIQLVELDVRSASPTFGKHVTLDVSEENQHIVWIPPGFANGFCIVSDVADVLYRCTHTYDPVNERCINALDPALAIPWRAQAPVMSRKDEEAPTFGDGVDTL